MKPKTINIFTFSTFSNKDATPSLTKRRIKLYWLKPVTAMQSKRVLTNCDDNTHAAADL